MDEYQFENLVLAAFHPEANKKPIGKGKSRIAAGHIQEWNFHLCEWNLLSMFLLFYCTTDEFHPFTITYLQNQLWPRLKNLDQILLFN